MTATLVSFFFFFNDTATTEIYTLSLHDALPIYKKPGKSPGAGDVLNVGDVIYVSPKNPDEPQGVWSLMQIPEIGGRSEEHTSELQSQSNLVCRLLLEKKNKKRKKTNRYTQLTNA